MKHSRPFPILLGSTLMLALATSAGYARQDEKAPLSGPAVKDRAVPGTSNSFSESMTDDKAKRSPRVPPRVFFEAVRALTSEETPEALRPADEQRETVRAIITDFQEAASDFRDENAEAIKALQEKAGMPSGPERRGQRRAKGEGRRGEVEVTPEQQAARDELRALMAKGPKPDDSFTRIWEVLSEPQREFVQARLDSHQQQRMTRGGGRNDRQAAKPVEGTTDDASLKEYEGLTPDEIREKIRSLPREEREAIRQKLRNHRSAAPKAEKSAKPE